MLPDEWLTIYLSLRCANALYGVASICTPLWSLKGTSALILYILLDSRYMEKGYADLYGAFHPLFLFIFNLLPISVIKICFKINLLTSPFSQSILHMHWIFRHQRMFCTDQDNRISRLNPAIAAWQFRRMLHSPISQDTHLCLHHSITGCIFATWICSNFLESF